MKNFYHELSEADVKTLICTLSLYECVDTSHVLASDMQNEINITCCKCAIEKLENRRTDFMPNEGRMMLVSLLVANDVLKGNFETSAEVKKIYSQYAITINRLLPIFNKMIS